MRQGLCGRQRALQFGMRADEPDAVERDHATAHRRGVGPDNAGLERGDQRHGLDDRAGQDRRVEDVGPLFAALARVGEVADEERGLGTRRRRLRRDRRSGGDADGSGGDDRGHQPGDRRRAPQRRVLQLGRHRHGIVLSPSVL
jgi:hypothetical protein